MKKILCLLCLILLLTTSGRQPAGENIRDIIKATSKTNQITIGYGFSSYAMFGKDPAVITDILNRFNALTFEKTDEALDLSSAFSVSLLDNMGNRTSFWVDRNSRFWLDDEAQSYRISSGSFDYEHLKKIYKNSSKAPQKEPSKSSENIYTRDELVNLVNSITQATAEKPHLLFSSNPYDYINAHLDTFNLLVEGGQHTVDIFTDILRNSTTYGLDKYIMAAACAKITGIGLESSSNIQNWASAEDWIELYEKEK